MWRSIDTAPRDGTPILAFAPSYYQGKGGILIALYQDGDWWDKGAFKTEITHWMPLPPKPSLGDLLK